MKRWILIFSILLAGAGHFALPANLFSQQKGERAGLSRMERDLDIMESVLDKLFESEPGSGFSHTRTRGIYLPGLGAVFQVASREIPIRSIEINKRSKTVIIHTREPEGTEPDSTTGEARLQNAMEPIMEFLGTYADAMQALPENENVIVIVLPAGYRTMEHLFSLPAAPKSVLGFAVLVRRQDIARYRKGNLSEQQFREKVRVIQLDPETQRQTDLRIFANVLQTAFSGYEAGSFRISRDVGYFYLPEFGAMYSLDAFYTGGRRYNIFINADQYRESLKMYEKQIAEYMKQIKQYQKQVQNYLKTRQKGTEPLPAPPEGEEPTPPISYDPSVWLQTTLVDSVKAAERMLAFQKFEDRLREYMLNYGRTLRILQPDQWLVISVRIRSRYEDLPERMVLQIKKSDLDRYDSRRLSKEAALKRIRVTYYER